MSIFSQLLVPRIATISQVIKEEEEEAKDRPFLYGFCDYSCWNLFRDSSMFFHVVIVS